MILGSVLFLTQYFFFVLAKSALLCYANLIKATLREISRNEIDKEAKGYFFLWYILTQFNMSKVESCVLFF